MQVLAIIGSRRKGNSYRLTEQIERLLTRNADVRFEYVFLSQVNLQACRGCYLCQSRGEQYCPLQDDRATLVQKMQSADGVIFVSPVHTSNVTGLMKNFMDRIAYNAHRPAFLGKPAMLVTTGSSGTKDTLKALSWFAYPGFELMSKIGLAVWPSPHYAWQRRRAVDRQIEKAAKRFGNALTRRSASLPLGKVLQLSALKASAMFDQTFFQADYDFYKDMNLDHLGMEVRWWKKVLGNLYYRMALKWMKRNLVPPAKEDSPLSEPSLPRRPTNR